MPAQRTTGLSHAQFADLLARVSALIGRWQPATGRRRSLRLAQALKATVMYKKNNVTQEFIAEILGTSQPVISRTIALIEPLIADALAAFVPDPAEIDTSQPVLVDGTLLPCWSWKAYPELWSGKHHTTGHNVQVITDLDGRILAIGDPCPGSWHDAHAYRETVATSLPVSLAQIGDKGYIGVLRITPTRKPAGREFTSQDRTYNKSINKIRAAVERGIANLKTWRILHADFRRPIEKFSAAFRATISLYFFATSYE